MMTATTQLDAFRQEIEKAGLTPPALIIADGKLHRFASNGDRADDSGWYTYFHDEPPAGVFGCWRKNFKQTWSGKTDSTLTPAERDRQRRRLDEARRQREQDEQLRHAEAAKRAQTIWDQAAPAPEDHPYLRKKQVQPHGLRVDNESRLIVPVMIDGSITSAQSIDGTGAKLFQPGGAVKGGSYTIGDLTETATVLICEGFATGASLHEATDLPVVVAFSAGNLTPVAEQVQQQFPTATIVVCGDHDLSGTGQREPRKAADTVSGVVALPEDQG
jgi:putative DNA primase/helicase